MIESITELERFSPEEIIDLPIKDAISNTFNHTIVYLAPSTPIEQAARFLIPLKDLNVNGIVVMENKELVGRLTAKHILQKVVDVGYSESLKLQIKDVMIDVGEEITTESSVSDALNLFKNTSCGFCPVIHDKVLVRTLSTRDFMPLTVAMKILEPVRTISSELIYTSGQISIEDAIRIMIKKNIRKIAIKSENEIEIIDNHSLLDYLYLWGRRESHLLDKNIDILTKSNLAKIPGSTSISYAAKQLLEQDMPCSVYDNKIVTPWDFVMKTLGQYLILSDFNNANILD